MFKNTIHDIKLQSFLDLKIHDMGGYEHWHID